MRLFIVLLNLFFSLSVFASTNILTIVLQVDLDTGQVFVSTNVAPPPPPINYPTNAMPPVYRSTLAPDAGFIVPDFNTSDLIRQINTQPSGELFIGNPVGNYSDGDKLQFRLKTINKQAIKWGSKYVGTAALNLPNQTTGFGSYDEFFIQFNADSNKWKIMATNFGE